MSPVDLPERIATKIEIDVAGCWLWQGARNSKRDDHGRYGMVRWGTPRVYVHRLVYRLLADPTFPLQPGRQGIQLDHHCEVKHCCNPAHLEPVTNAENIRRYWARRSHAEQAMRPAA